MCPAGCGRPLALVEGATTRATLLAQGLTTRSGGILLGRNLETVELPPLLRSPRPRRHPRPLLISLPLYLGRPTWRRTHSSGQTRKRSCPPLAPRRVSASPRQARRSAIGWPLQARQRTNSRARVMAESPLAAFKARPMDWSVRRARNIGLWKRRSGRGSAFDKCSARRKRRSVRRRRLSRLPIGRRRP